MKPESLKVLIVTEVSADAAQIVHLLEDHFEQLHTSTIESRFVADFERIKPDVVVLAFTTLERAERYSLGLYRHSEIVHTVSHRSIVLCNKDNVHRAFELCRKEYFDDYVMYWPLVHDTPRLAMSILIAGRSLQAQRDAPPARQVAAHARSVSQLEAVLDDHITVGRQHAEAVSQALQAVEAEVAAQPATTNPAPPPIPDAQIPTPTAETYLSAPATVTTPSAAPAAAQSAAPLAPVTDAFPLTDTFDLDLDGVPAGTDFQAPLATTPREDVIREVQLRVDDAKKTVVPLTEWIGGLKKDVKPQLDAARQLGELAGNTQPKILVVDDDTFQCKLLERLLSNAGYRSIVAQSGTDALALLGRQQPDLILMDVGLPDLNGVELTRRIKASPTMANIPIVMITGHSERQVLAASLKAGAVDFLVKPFDREVLLNKILRHLAQ
ncbi:response regulator [Thauera sp.]|jgi:CheY-like chemotaxis protein|uniref:response regulator n=1 Tax=Thauera sp. TaxID=1905334 RepID=UPI002A3601A8|nr:response regulator [Thauera sp.]MDX9885757.1 response regulator [Thauera sp.]